MTASSRKIEWVVWGGLLLIIAGISGAFIWSKRSGQLPLPVLGQISDFSLTNQNGDRVAFSDLKGKVWIADIIFTRCPGPCPRMTQHLAEIQAQLPIGGAMKLVTLTSDPEFDTPPVLQKYAKQFGIDSNRWWLLTGAKREIQRLAINDFKFVLVEKQPGDRESADDLFIHSTWFVLVDQQGRVRGWNDGEGRLHAYFDSEDPSARARILAAAKQLLEKPSS